MTDRTEELALRRLLPVTMGGAAYELRTLTIDESDAWLVKVGAALSTIDVEDIGATSGVSALLTSSSSAVVELVAAYDLDDTLGGVPAIRGKMSKRELRATMDAMVSAEDPFGEAVALSVATGFGLPSRFLAAGIRVVLDELAVSAPESLTDGRSDSASTTPDSAASGPANSSPSDGPIPITNANVKKRRG